MVPRPSPAPPRSRPPQGHIQPQEAPFESDPRFFPRSYHCDAIAPLNPIMLLHGDPVRSYGVLERHVEVQLEAGIKREGVGCDLNHMDLVIPLEVDLPEVVLVQEVVSDDEARVIL